MAIISKSISTTTYSDQHKPIKIDWTTRSFNFQEPYVVSVNKDLNSQLLTFECDDGYDGVDLGGTNIYVDYSTDWQFNSNTNSQGSVLIDDTDIYFDAAASKLKIQWLLNQLQTYRPGKVQFGLTFQMEQTYDSQYFFSWDSSGNLGWKQNFWFKVLNPTATKANWLLALIKNENEFEIEKNNYVSGVNTCITIGSTVLSDSTVNPYMAITEQPDDWDTNYGYYMKKSTYDGVDYYSFYKNVAFDKTNCYKNKFVGLSYKPAYVLKTLTGVFEVEKGLDITESQYIPMTDGLINEKAIATEDDIAEVKDYVDSTNDTTKANFINYITPELYGAKGDAKTDDTTALLQSIAAAAEQKKQLVLQDKVYLTSSTLVIGSNMFIEGNGATIIVTANVDLLKITGSDNTIRNLKLTFKAKADGSGKQINIPGGAEPFGGLDGMNFTYTKNLIYILAAGNSVLRNTFSNVQCYSQINPYYDWMPSLFQGTGIRIEATNNTNSYVYSHNFSDCKVSYLKTGLRIKDAGTMGINANTYGIDFWACRTGVWGNPGGSLFRGSHQSPQYVTGYAYVLENASDNKFEGTFYDTRYSDSVPNLATDIANIYGTPSNAALSKMSDNSISGGEPKNYNFTNPSDYTLLTSAPADWSTNYSNYYKNWGYESSNGSDENVKVFRPVMAGGAPSWQANKFYRKSGSNYILLTEKPGMWESQKYITDDNKAYYYKNGETYSRVIYAGDTTIPTFTTGLYYSCSNKNTLSPLMNNIIYSKDLNKKPIADIGLPNADAEYRAHNPFNPAEYGNSLLNDELDISLSVENLKVSSINSTYSNGLYGSSFPMNLKPLTRKNGLTTNGWSVRVPGEQLCLEPITSGGYATMTVAITQSSTAAAANVKLRLDSLCLYCVISNFKVSKVELKGYNYSSSSSSYTLVNTKDLTLDGIYSSNSTSCIAGNFDNGVGYSKIEMVITFDTTVITGYKIYLNHIYGRIVQANANSRWPIVPSLVDMVYPIGSIYMSVNNVNPKTLFGGTWEQLKDRFLLGAGDTYTAGATGGEAAITLTTDQMPEHSHQQRFEVSGYTDWEESMTSYMQNDDFRNPAIRHHAIMNVEYYTNPAGKGYPHNNMPPYLTVYMWKRTA